MRVNSTGINRENLAWALTQPAIVALARERDSCLLCRESGVNEAGLCKCCQVLLRDDESRLAEKWRVGNAP